LAGSINNGYVLSAGEINLRVEDGTFELSGDGDYKVNESSDLVERQAFHSIEELVVRVL
jgi:hypothetical protein